MHVPRSRRGRAARRSSARGIFGSAAVLCRRTNPAWVTTGAVRPDETAIIRSRSPRVSSTGAAHAVPGFFERRVFEVRVFEMRCAAAARNPRPRRRPCRRDATTRNNREGAMPLASNAADRTSGVNDGRMPVPRMNFRSDDARLWSRPYTLWRADRLAICGRNAVVYRFARQNCPRDRVEGRPFLPGWRTRRIERPTPRGRWVCVVSWWSMTTGIPALP